MKITISGTPKEIADLATELQNRHKSDSNRVMLRRKGTLIERVPAEQANTVQGILEHNRRSRLFPMQD
jgi:hypothetical protein